MNKKSVVNELRITVSLSILALLVLCLTIFGYDNYQQSISIAKQDVARHAKSLALDMQSELIKQTNQLAVLSTNKVLAELPQNILFTQYAFRELKRTVETNPFIDAAFISDGSRFIVEGFPIATLKFNNEVIKAYTQDRVNAFYVNTQINMLYLQDKIDGLQPTVNGSVVLAIPLLKSNSSLIRPYDTTAILFLLLNPEHFVNEDERLAHSNVQLLIDGVTWFQFGQQNLNQDEVIVEQHTASKKNEYGLDFEVKVKHSEQYFTSSVFESIILSSLLVILLFVVLQMYLMGVTKRLTHPIELLEEMTEKIRKGHYEVTGLRSEYTEFDKLFNTVDNMTKTITAQINDLHEQRTRAEASERAKAVFLANMSHEIRTPMNGILGTLQILQRQPLPKESADLIEKGVLSSKVLLTIVNDILDFSKIEAGHLHLEAIPTNISSLTQDIVAELSPQAESKGLQLDLIQEPTFSSTWFADPVRIKQILLNLISNAIKFTDKGTVTVELAVDQNSGHVRIIVMDTGIGMSETMCQNLFNRFEQADSSTTRRFGGTGLGMTITRQLVELMKGEITVSSTIGKGTKFVILLPLIETTLDVEEEHHHTESVTPDLTGKHILLAEDNKINQTVFLAMMRPTNATITIAEDGVEAVDAFKNYSPDLIFMDIQMPNMDGIDACKSIRKINTDIPIIALTANVMDQDVKTYMSSGFDSHLGKPIELNALYREATLYLVSKDQ